MTEQHARVAFDMATPTTGSAESINVSRELLRAKEFRAFYFLEVARGVNA